MKSVCMTDVATFARQWLHAGYHLVQHWPTWESQAAEFFDVPYEAGSDDLHGVMAIVCNVFFGSTDAVKSCMRASSPRVILRCMALLGHLHQFSVVLEAEQRFRAGDLQRDWSLEQSEAGELTVRSVFKRAVKETEH